jgi:carbamoyl-phosphate synthase large subunit
MPKRTDLETILLIGSGPIVIGQGAEFDYSGTQAVRALKEEGYRVVLVNSNPATIMTDPELADRTYIEPVTPEWVAKVIERERPDALLPTMGGQTALNVAMALQRDGTLARYGVELIGANERAIRTAEDREEFASAMRRIGLATPPGRTVRSIDDGLPFCDRPSPSAAPEAASRTTSRTSRRCWLARWSSPRCTPSWWSAASSGGRSTNWR